MENWADRRCQRERGELSFFKIKFIKNSSCPAVVQVHRGRGMVELLIAIRQQKC